MSDIDALLRDLKKYGTAGRDCALSAEDALAVVAALEAAREDAGKWAILSMRRGDWPELDIAMEDAEDAIDQARGKGVAE